MAVPKHKVSKSKRNIRRSHLGLKPLNIVLDKDSGEPKLPHHISKVDGTYKGRKVIVQKVKNKNTEE